MDYDLVYPAPSPNAADLGHDRYSTLAAFQAASGQEAKGIEADPRWSSPTTGDFRSCAGSPAIDRPTAAIGGEPTTDVLGNPRVDDPATPNTGVGPRTYDDRGAYEFQPGSPPPDVAPTAALSVSPSSGVAPLSVTADATGSTDTDATPIASYTFEFGDGTVVGPQPGATATHTYATTGTYTVSVTVTDTAGLTSTAATATVTVTNRRPTSRRPPRSASVPPRASPRSRSPPTPPARPIPTPRRSPPTRSNSATAPWSDRSPGPPRPTPTPRPGPTPSRSP